MQIHNLWNNSNIIGNLDEKKYNVFKSSLMKKEGNIKHLSERKLELTT